MKKNLAALLAFSLLSFGMESKAQWNLTGNNNATATSLLGTTNSVSLNLATKNATRLTIDTLGRVGIGTTTMPNIFSIKGSGGVPAASWANAGAPLFTGFGEQLSGNADFILGMGSSLSVARPVFIGRRSRGTLAAPAAVVSNDQLMSFLTSGYDGTSFQNPAAVDFYVDGTPTAGNVPARISFVTGSNGGNRAERLRIGNTGDIAVNNTQLTVTAATGNVSVGSGNFSVAKNSSLKGLVGVNGDTLSGTALNIQADATHNGIVVADPVNKYILYSSKSGINQGIYVAKSSATSTNGCITGVGANFSIGLEGYASKGNGVFAQNDTIGAALYATSGKSIGVYGSTGNPSSYAGYFNGDVFSSGQYVGSDARLKTNITDFGNALQIISALQPKNYDFKREGNYSLLQLPQGNHYGLIAQEVEKILPNLVKETSVEIKGKRSADGLNTDGATSTRVNFKAVNYTELIPVIIKAMQEQEANAKAQATQLEEQKNLLNQQSQQIAELVALVEKLSPGAKSAVATSAIKLSTTTLEQNVPNPPVGNATTIGYNISKAGAKATLVITDIYGKTIKQTELTNTGKGLLKVDTTGLSAGTYIYSLVVDGKMMESKKMTVAGN